MRYLDWQPNQIIVPPVYLDANVLVGSKVSNHPLYASCVQVLASILTAQACILVSALSLDESIWATAKLAYLELNNLPSNSNWSKKVYQRWCEKIFEKYGSWLNAACDMVRDLKNAGAQIDFVPGTYAEFNNMLDMAPRYMSQFKLTPADAFHLALAGGRAQTFITADADFEILQSTVTTGGLTVIHLPRP